MVAIRCPKCDAAGTLPDAHLKRRVRCKKCGEVFVAVAANEAPPESVQERRNRLWELTKRPLADEADEALSKQLLDLVYRSRLARDHGRSAEQKRCYAEIKTIGESLNSRGGTERMLLVCLRAMNQDSAATEVDVLWEGIGGWKFGTATG